MNSVAQESSDIPVFRVPTIEEIREARKKRPIAVMLSVFMDESSDGRRQRVFAVVGIIGTQEEWDKLESLWKERMQEKIFHATDCAAGGGDFKGIPTEDNHKLYRDLIQLLAQSNLVGYGTAIDIQAYAKCIPNVLSGQSYYHCFTRTILALTAKAKQYIPNPNKVEFTFHFNRQMKENTAHLYEYLQSRYNWDEYTSCMADTIRFAVGHQSIGIQAADLWAMEVRKDFDNWLHPAKAFIRPGMDKLMSTGRFRVDYLGKTEIERLWENMKLLEQILGDDGWADYEKWRLKKKRPPKDNARTRTDYLFYHASQLDQKQTKEVS